MPNKTSDPANQDIGAYYDEMPYVSLPFPASSPDSLAAVCHLFGLKSASVSHCRVLEIGCASGGNLIPHAQAHPESTYIGIDLSQVQIAQGVKRIKALGVNNISLQRLNVGNVTPALGEFDFIICHGVYSWVPSEVQKMIMQTCAQSLAPDGVAFISYNCYPGWKFKEVVRDAMRYRSKDKTAPTEKLAYARGMFNFLHDMAPENSLLKQVFSEHGDTMKSFRDDYLVHEYLEPYNQPCYFHEFIDAARSSHLAYVADATPATMFVQNQPASIAEPLLKECGNDQIAMEQYIDLVTNRQFRQTILTKKHRAADISYRLRKSQISGMFFAGNYALPEGETLTTHENQQDFIIKQNARIRITVKTAIGKAAVKVIGDHFPAALTLRQIVEQAQFLAQRVRPDDTDAVLSLLESLIIHGTLTFRLAPNHIAARVADKPQGYRPAQAILAIDEHATSHVINPWHNAVELNLPERLILSRLDGSHTDTDLVEWLLQKEAAGDIHFKQEGDPDGKPVSDPEQKRLRAQDTVRVALERLCRHGLLSLS